MLMLALLPTGSGGGTGTGEWRGVPVAEELEAITTVFLGSGLNTDEDIDATGAICAFSHIPHAKEHTEAVQGSS